MRRAEQLLLLTALALIGVALGRALTSPGPADARPLPQAMRLDAYRWIAGHEQAMRDHAMADYPADAWSQDDHFHSSERERANQFASTHRVRRQDVFRAFDDGMRERWPVPDAGVVRATVPPCRPRAIY
jgi:hypothetical protein